MSLSFSVFGVAQPKGSANAFVPKGWSRAVVTGANAKNKGWQQLVAKAALHAIAAQPAFRLMDTSAFLSVVFYLPRPKAIRHGMPSHTKKPDLDKLVRSVKDALTQVVWRDDALVSEIVARKQYAVPGKSPRADIRIGKCGEYGIFWVVEAAPRAMDARSARVAEALTHLNVTT